MFLDELPMELQYLVDQTTFFLSSRVKHNTSLNVVIDASAILTINGQSVLEFNQEDSSIYLEIDFSIDERRHQLVAVLMRSSASHQTSSLAMVKASYA